jgi:fatty-acyl-CoA synthase
VSAATIAGLLRARAEQTPDAPGYCFRADGEWTGWSWSDYWEHAAGAGAGLREEGVRPGDRVLMFVADVQAAVATLFGAWAIGAVPIQVGAPYRLTDPAAFVRELGRTADRLSARALVVSEAFAAPVADSPAPAPVLSAEALAQEGGSVEPPGVDAAHRPALIQLTSGSTGHPRGVVVSHSRLLGHLAAISEALPLAGEEAREVSWLPLNHDMGLIGGLLFPLFNGFPLYHLSPLAFRADPFVWLQTLSDARATCSPAPPSAYALALRLARRAAEAGLDLRPWACAMIGAEAIPARLLREFAGSFAACGFRPEAFFPVYGLAEATVAVTFPELLAPTRFDRVDRTLLEREARAVPCDAGPDALELVGVGRPIPGTEVRIVAGGADAASREIGEIWVRSDTLMDGYYDDPAATAAAMEGPWLKTGDLGYRADGELFVTGREKDLIIKAGHNLLPEAIEDIAGAVDGVRAGCVVAVGVPSPQRATELVCVVAETKLDAGEHAQLAARVRDALRLRGIAVDRVLLVPAGELPKTTSGKLRRREVARGLASAGPP